MRYRDIEFKLEITFIKHPSGATIVKHNLKEHIKRIDGIIIESKKQVLLEKTKERSLKNRKHQLKQTYGITLEDYDRMFNQQAGKCAICEKHQSELNYNLYVDHDHKTNKVRGLLCSSCNTCLFALDNPGWLEKAKEYLYEQI